MNKTSSFLLTLSIALAAVLTFSCSDGNKDEESPGNNLIENGDSSSSEGDRRGESSSSSVSGVIYGNSVNYGNETYKTVVIGDQTWFARNLNYEVEGSRCYGDDPANCDIYGRLYDWETAMEVCPNGWHLPNEDEWMELIRFVEDDVGAEHHYNPHTSQTAGIYLTATSGWNNNAGGNGTDNYGFYALPGGGINSDSSLTAAVGYGGVWWSATEYNSDYVDCWFIHPRVAGECLYYYHENDRQVGAYKSDLLSVRCLKN